MNLLHNDSMQLMKRKNNYKIHIYKREEVVCNDVKDANVLIACYWKLQLQCKLTEQKKKLKTITSMQASIIKRTRLKKM